MKGCFYFMVVLGFFESKGMVGCVFRSSCCYRVFFSIGSVCVLCGELKVGVEIRIKFFRFCLFWEYIIEGDIVVFLAFLEKLVSFV